MGGTTPWAPMFPKAVSPLQKLCVVVMAEPPQGLTCLVSDALQKTCAHSCPVLMFSGLKKA